MTDRQAKLIWLVERGKRCKSTSLSKFQLAFLVFLWALYMMISITLMMFVAVDVNYKLNLGGKVVLTAICMFNVWGAKEALNRITRL